MSALRSSPIAASHTLVLLLLLLLLASSSPCTAPNPHPHPSIPFSPLRPCCGCSPLPLPSYILIASGGRSVDITAHASHCQHSSPLVVLPPSTSAHRPSARNTERTNERTNDPIPRRSLVYSFTRSLVRSFVCRFVRWANRGKVQQQQQRRQNSPTTHIHHHLPASQPTPFHTTIPVACSLAR